MAIRFDYPVAKGITTAYASGQQGSRREANKYILDLLDRNAKQRAIGASRQMTAEPQGTWTDPLADDPSLTPQERVQRRAARKSRDRKNRLGKDIPAEWQPTFTSQEEMEWQREQEKIAGERRFQTSEREARQRHSMEMQEGRQQFERETAATERATDYARRLITESTREIDEGLYSPEDITKLRGVMDTIDKVLGTRRIGSEAAREEVLSGPLRQLEEIRSRRSAPLPPSERFDKETFMKDGVLLQPKKGGGYEPVIRGQKPQSQIAAEEAEKARKEEEKRELDIRKMARSKYDTYKLENPEGKKSLTDFYNESVQEEAEFEQAMRMRQMSQQMQQGPMAMNQPMNVASRTPTATSIRTVSSPEEARKLQPGTQFMTPDGKSYMVPYISQPIQGPAPYSDETGTMEEGITLEMDRRRNRGY